MGEVALYPNVEGQVGSEAGSYLRLIDFVYHSTLGLRVIQKKKRRAGRGNDEDRALQLSTVT